MDMLTVDVTDIDGVGTGDEVVFLGSQDDKSIDAREMASWIGTIPYEIFAGSAREWNGNTPYTADSPRELRGSAH